MRRERISHFRREERAFVLVAAAIASVVILGILGLSADLARMYVAKNEIQAYVDAASIAAAFELNGTPSGVIHARDSATSYPNKWNFQTAVPQNITVAFSDQPEGPYVDNPANPAGVRYVQVSAEGSVIVYFLPGFSSFNTGVGQGAAIARQQRLQATARSGQLLVTRFSEGLLPYSPDAIDPADKTNFGFTPGQMHTLRWPPPGQRGKKENWCDGDEAAGFVTPSGSNDRGFIDIAGNGSSDIRQAIVNNVQTRPLEIGDVVGTSGGNRGTESDAMRERFSQDSDTASQTYQEYISKINDPNYTGPKGNGRRFVVVPVNDPATNEVIGFAGFLLHASICSPGGDSLYGTPTKGGGSNVATCCGEYVGPALVPGRKAGSEDVGAYRVRLLR